ncbi:MAG: ATP-binding protein [Lewinellaceae bacterium]|nr:ATP-binding protein [Lewinellaceae bacterium]
MNIPGKYLPRNATSDLGQLLNLFPAVCIIGARQVGKTTLAKTLTQDRDSIYLDLESERDRRKLRDPYLLLSRYENQCVILDEIQRMPGLFEMLRGMIDENRRPGRFLLLGSAAPALLQQTAETLAGRIAYIELPPLNLTEITTAASQETHWLRGGFPDSLLAESDEASVKWRQNFIRTYVERELGILGLGAEPNTVRRFWQMLASVNASIWKGEAFASSLGVSGVTVKKYLDFLENAFLITVLHPWHGKIAKRLVKSPKVYVRDSGLLHGLLHLDFYDDLLGHPSLGASWEGYVIEQVHAVAGDRLEIFYYRTHNGAEFDLVLVKAGRPVAAAEIKFSSTPDISRGLHISIADLETAHNFVIVPQGDDYPLSSTIEVVSLRTFLEKHLPGLW